MERKNGRMQVAGICNTLIATSEVEVGVVLECLITERNEIARIVHRPTWLPARPPSSAKNVKMDQTCRVFRQASKAGSL